MSEKKLARTYHLIETFTLIKEYILVFAMVLAVSLYAIKYIDDISNSVLKWICYSVLILIAIAILFFNVFPIYLINKEISYRPTGNPDKFYFTTTPRTDDNYHFFDAGYEHYLNWLRHPRSPVLYLTGSSGTGKSSLINAYLAPKLEKESSPKKSVYVLRSYHDPLKVLYEALKIVDNTDADINEETVFNEISKASQMLSPNEQILIILDQFEEFFLLRNAPEALEQDNEEIKSIEELKKFFKRFINDPPRGVHILLSYRDDFQQLIDQLELPARSEHINFEQVNPLSFDQATKFLKGCPGMEIPEEQLNRTLKEAASIDTPITLRPIVLNLFGIILQQMVGQRSALRREGNLIRKYIIDSLGKQLKYERATLLRTMLTDFKTARPQTLNEMSKISKLSVSQLDTQMIAMQHYGLVRCLDAMEPSQGKRKWQIAHDFIALQLEKVVYGINKTFWQKTTLWIAPVLLVALIIFTSSYLGNINDQEKKKAIARIENAGLTWIQRSKTLRTMSAIDITDSLFQSLIPDFVTIQPDSLEIQVTHFGTFDQTYVILKLFTLHQFLTFNGLDKVKSLKKIFLNDNYGIENLDGLQGLKNLTHLNLISCGSLKNLDGIKELTGLTHLTLTRCPSLQEIDAIKRLDSLVVLDLSYDSLQNIDSLQGLTVLKSLDLSGCSRLQNVDGLEGLKALTTLSLRDCTGLQNVDGLKESTGLTYLVLSSDSSLQNVNALRNLTGLTYLDLGTCSKLQNVNTLEDLSNLTYLDLSDCSDLQNIDGLKKLTRLTHLYLSNCPKLKNLDALRGLTNLKALNLTNCKEITEKQIEDLRGVLKDAHTVSDYTQDGPFK